MGFYDAEGNLALEPIYQRLKNEMYPDNGEFDYDFYQKKIDGRMNLYYIDENGCVDLGEVEDAIPLRKDLIAVKRDKDYPYYGVINSNGKVVITDDQYGEILGISKDGFMVCEVEKDVFAIINLDGKSFEEEPNYEDYIVNPNSSLICGFNSEICGIWEHPSDIRNECALIDDAIPVVYDDVVFAKKTNSSRKYYYHRHYSVDLRHGYHVYGSLMKIESWKKGVLSYYDCDSEVSGWMFADISNNFYPGTPEVITNFGVVYYDDRWIRLLPKGSPKAIFTDDLYLFCSGNDQKHCFLGIQDDNTLAFYKYLPDGVVVRNLVSYKDCKSIDVDMVASYSNYICVHYVVTKRHEENHHVLIINREGVVVKSDHFGVYGYLCGPFEDKYFYLDKDGDLCWKSPVSREGKKLTWKMQAEKLLPLGSTGHFLVTIAGEYQIIDRDGTKLGKSFSDFNLSLEYQDEDMVLLLMDFVLHSHYLPVKHAEGKCGLIDTNGKVIVPCEYDEVEDLNSIFKQQAIVVF